MMRLAGTVTGPLPEPEEPGTQLLPVVSIVLSAVSVLGGGVASFWAYSMPRALLLPAPYTGWTVFMAAATLWFAGLLCGVAAVSRKRSAASWTALLLTLAAPVLVVALAILTLLIGLNGHAFVF